MKYFTNPEEITEEDKQFITDLDYNGIEFPVQEKIFNNFSNLGFRLKVWKLNGFAAFTWLW